MKSKKTAIEAMSDLICSLTEEIMDSFRGASKEKSLGAPSPLLKEVINEAAKWVGVSELKSDPGGGVDSFRKAVDASADGEPWCCAFVQYCTRAVGLRNNISSVLFPTELCYTMWKDTPKKYRLSKPIPGSIIVWNYPGTIRGHTGVVVSLDGDHHVNTIEGNTSVPGKPNISGVCRKRRSISGDESMVVLGFLVPFA